MTKRKKSYKADRNQKIYNLHKEGMTYVDIGYKFPKENNRPLSPQRVQQIIKNIKKEQTVETIKKNFGGAIRRLGKE